MSKVLIVTTSHDHFQGANPHPTGVWMEEFALPYLELLKNGVEMTIASPKGGAMPVDPRSLPTPEQEKAWQDAIEASKQTVKLSEVKSTEFNAIFLPGGHGPMFDLPDNSALQQLLREFQEDGKIIAAVCHGPAGLVGATLADGTPLVKGKILTSYTYSEEVAAKLDKEVPFILEQRLRELGAYFIPRENKADHVERDGNLITGQNPNSSTSIAQALVTAIKKQQQLLPIFAHTPEAIVTAKTVAEFPVNTFLENIAVNAQGDIFVTSYEEGKIYQVSEGIYKEFANVKGNAAGIAFDRDGNLLIAGAHEKTASDKIQTVFQIDKNGSVEPLVSIADAIFLNGLTYLNDNRYLIADAYKGVVWEVDVTAKTAHVWLEHEWLKRLDTANPFPAINGVKIYGNALYASNTQRQQVICIPLTSDYTPGIPEVFVTNVHLDDFAFDMHGNLYGTTHVYNSAVRISRDGQVTTIAKAAQGMTGNTALAFGRTSDDRTSVYVTTNGGMSLPPATGVEPAKVVRLDVGIEGLVLGE
jgi:putative intracellular protease/amidase